ncbi:unnamed protein product [Ascophyllum nodosum]
MGPFELEGRDGWLSGGGLLATALGFFGAWWSLSFGLEAVGRPGAPWINPRVMRVVRRLAGPAASVLVTLALLLRARRFGNNREGLTETPSLLRELLGALEGTLPAGGSVLLLLIEDVIAISLALQAAGLLKSVWRAVRSPLSEKKAFFADRGFEVLRHLPAVARRLEKEVDKTEAHLRATLRPGGGEDALRALPETGRSSEQVLSEMQTLAEKERSKWAGGRASGAVYDDSDGHSVLTSEAYGLFSRSNPLHPDLWPSGLKFEAEVISMTARLLDGGDSEVCGVLTSGGTESIIVAARAHRNFFRERGVTSPEIVAATSAHAAIEKACDMMEIRLIKVPVDPVTMRADARATARSMSANTIMIYASAPSYPHGVIDPVQDLAKLARKHGCGLHVDCCLGGFVLPFARQLGYPMPPFDFAVDGVTSMSADTHKYGYAPKGTSVALFRSKQLRHHAYFCFPEWTGGLYATPTIAGSRPGGLSAACWAAMVSLGQDGYLKAVKGIMETVKEVAEGVTNIKGLSLVGEPTAMVVCFRGEGDVNIYKVGDCMSHRGWSLNTLQRPPCLHLCVTTCHVGKAKEFLEDLAASTSEAAATAGKGDDNSMAAIYGMAASLPAGPVNVLLRAYTDVTLGP